MYISRLGNVLTDAVTPATRVDGLFGVPFCGEPDQPGAALGEPALVDFSEMPVSTPDQQRIEAVLDRVDLSRASVLHVGVGNSFLAAKFAGRGRSIDGVTVSRREMERAASLNLPNYRVHCLSKYGPWLAGIGGPYDVIVDNNLASFACCGFHLLMMFSNYRRLLSPGGHILTDEQGMGWSAGDPRWKLTPADLAEVARRFRMGLSLVAERVYALSKQ